MTILKRVMLSLLILGTHSLLAQDYLTLVKNHIYGKHPSLQQNTAVDWVITDQINSKRNGVTHLYLRQMHDGIEIFNANINVAIKNGKVVSLTGKIVQAPKLEQTTSAAISAEGAIHQAARALGVSVTEQLKTLPSSSSTTARSKSSELLYTPGGISLENIPVKKVLVTDKQGNLKMCWDLSIYEKSQENWWSLRIDASTGAVVEKNNWVTKCSFEPAMHAAKQGVNADEVKHFHSTSVATNSYNVFPFPLESPSEGDRVLTSNPSDLTASPFGWHDTDGVSGADYTFTRGNNVYAYEDMANLNIAGYSPEGTQDLIFDFAYSVNEDVLPNRDAAITNLFYANNRIHDVLYHYGFDEESGNFQYNNYGNGGLGEDHVRAEAQDGSGTDNANFATPPDGQRPRMQMYLWNPALPPFVIDEPSLAAGEYLRGLAFFGPVVTTPLEAQVVLATIGDGTTQCCTAITNDVAGKIAVIDRGSCTFKTKVKNAQDAGAVGVIIVDNVVAEFPLGLADDPAITAAITIPSFSIRKEDGDKIKAAIAAAENLSIVFPTWSKRDASVDNGIVIHEYGHGVSNRLTGGPSNTSCLGNSEQMGEGWSDYFALMLTMKDSYTATSARGIGTFSIGEPVSGIGIRLAPYTTDMSVNGYTYDDIKEADEKPHDVGFIWCTMLWEMTWKFIDRYGYSSDITNGTAGNNIALQLVVDGLKLQPCGPGFIDGRDALLLADKLNNDGANQDIIWEAFAKRGLGASADQVDPNSVLDGVEAFDMPAAVAISLKADKGFTGVSPVTYSITAKNTSFGSIEGVLIEDVVPEGMTYVEGSVSNDGAVDNGTLSFSGIALETDGEQTVTFQALPEGAETTVTRFTDDAELGMDKWNAASVSGTNTWDLTEGKSHSGDNSFSVESVDTKTDQTLTLKNPITIGSETQLTFYHAFYTEKEFDGGVVEISKDGGLNWIDLGPKMILGGYNATMSTESDTPLGGRQAFSGYHPTFMKTTIDLGTFAGQGRLIRFRSVTDTGTGRDGWYLDDIYFHEGEDVEITNEACVRVGGEGDPICANASIVIVDMVPAVTANIPDQRATATLPFEFAFSETAFQDPEQAGLTYTATLSSGNELPEWLSFDPADRTFSGTPGEDDDAIIVRVTATDANGGWIYDDFELGIDMITSAEQLSSRLVAVYPNPTTGSVTIQLREQRGKYLLTIRDLLGHEVARPIRGEQQAITVDMSSMPVGLYIIDVRSKAGSYQTQLIKK